MVVVYLSGDVRLEAECLHLTEASKISSLVFLNLPDALKAFAEDEALASLFQTFFLLRRAVAEKFLKLLLFLSTTCAESRLWKLLLL